MTDSAQPGELASLEPLEPLDPGAAASNAPANEDATLQVLRSGLPAPGYNPYCRDKTFYRFLFAGVLLIVGTLMPFSAEISRAGYQSMSGGLYLVLGIAMTWSWWASIANNRPVGVKWLMLCLFPMVGGLWNILAFDPAAALELAKARGWMPADAVASMNLKELFGDMATGLARRSAESLQKAEGFWRLLGPGHFFIFLGGAIAELGFLGGIVAGAKKNSADQKAKQVAAAERKRR